MAQTSFMPVNCQMPEGGLYWSSENDMGNHKVSKMAIFWHRNLWFISKILTHKVYSDMWKLRRYLRSNQIASHFFVPSNRLTAPIETPGIGWQWTIFGWVWLRIVVILMIWWRPPFELRIWERGRLTESISSGRSDNLTWIDQYGKEENQRCFGVCQGCLIV